MMRFVILAAPRTGSNLLCTLLQSHPDILCHHELFNPSDMFYALPLRETDFELGSMSFRDQNPNAFLQQIWEQNLNHRAVGFKMTHRQHLDAFRTVCADKSIHKIVLKRQSQLKTYVSRLIAEDCGIWEDYQRIAPSNETRQVYVDYQQLKNAIAFNDHYYQRLENQIEGPCIHVNYEQLSEIETQKALLEHLKMPLKPLFASSRQQNKHPVAQLISNADELSNQLQKNLADKPLFDELSQTEISAGFIDHLSTVPPSKFNKTLEKR